MAYCREGGILRHATREGGSMAPRFEDGTLVGVDVNRAAAQEL